MKTDPFGLRGFSGIWPGSQMIKSAGRLHPRPVEPVEAYEPEPAPLEQEPGEKPTVELRNPRWEAAKVGFNEETPISVEVVLPPDKAHKTRVTFELFADTPKGPERISQGEANAKDGKAVCAIPVYIPTYKDGNGERLAQVEYWFTAKHPDAADLDGSGYPKLVDEMAERLIDTHSLPDLTFATGKSFLHPDQAQGLKDLCAAIAAWLEKNPDGKLTVFGHADAVGKEEPNKALSERRAKAVHALLLKDAAAYAELDGKEKWGLEGIQALLTYLGHDAGAADGKDGPKTQAAVKAFQGEKGLAQDGKAGPDTRKALYQTFMEDCNSLSLKKANFDDLNGKPTAGCSEFNLKEATQGDCEANRRVVVVWVKSNKNFPIQYPCGEGDTGVCKKQVARKGNRRTSGFGCFFYDGLVVENGNGAARSALGLKSSYAHEQLTRLATELSEANFIVMLMPIFGDDVPVAAYGKLYRALSDGALPPPEIEVRADGMDGHDAGFDQGAKKVLVGEPLAKAAGNEEEKRQLLFIALVEEYGHYIDWTLRNEYSQVGGDAAGDEGAIYSYRMAFIDILDDDKIHFADLESPAYSGPLELDMSAARAGAEKYANIEEQIWDGKNGEIEYFGAGRGSGHAGSYGHQSIEEALVEAKFDAKKDLHRIYFGNWLRDFSQAVDPAIVRPSDKALAELQAKYKDKKVIAAFDTTRLSRKAITKLIGILAWKEFSKEDVRFSLKAKDLLVGPKGMGILGGYRAEEHIDNPFTTDPVDASLVDPVFARPPTSAQLALDPVTGLKNYIATPTGGQSFPTAVEYMEGRLRLAMAAGYTDDGLRYFGEGLHVLEDFFSHSNFIEVSLIKLGYAKVVPWVTVPAGTRRIPIVTGCFGKTDVLASVGPKLANLIPHEMEDYTKIRPGERTPTDQTILIVLEDLKDAQKADKTQKNENYLGVDAATALDLYEKYLRIRDLVNSGKADLHVEWIFEAVHTMMQAFFVVTSFTTYILFENASHLVDDAQTLSGGDVGLNPTHSQLAKDHDVHHFHAIAAEVAKLAVADVGKAMRRFWVDKEFAVDPVAMAKSYIRHPLDHGHPQIDEVLRKWAASHPAELKRAESKTIVEHLHHEGEEKYEELAKHVKVWRKRIEEIMDYFSKL